LYILTGVFLRELEQGLTRGKDLKEQLELTIQSVLSRDKERTIMVNNGVALQEVL
jgi:hypothetical protein